MMNGNHDGTDEENQQETTGGPTNSADEAGSSSTPLQSNGKGVSSSCGSGVTIDVSTSDMYLHLIESKLNIDIDIDADIDIDIDTATARATHSPRPPPKSKSTSKSTATSTLGFVAKEQERKQLILYLLAQVCALHDSTPKTFIVHVLSLYESGILDDDSIALLMSHGLVPNAAAMSVPEAMPGQALSGPGALPHDNHATKNEDDSSTTDSLDQMAENQIEIFNKLQIASNAYMGRDRVDIESSAAGEMRMQQQQQALDHDATTTASPFLATDEPLATSESNPLTTAITTRATTSTTDIVHVHAHPHGRMDTHPNATTLEMEIELQNRSRKVYAIRKHLELHETMAQWKHFDTCNLSPTNHNNTSPPTPTASSDFAVSSSWTVEHHPLSFSRYNRDFEQRAMLASGSFGQVFHATNKLDGCDYAVKRVAFSAKGYDTKQVEVVVREVQCLAKMGHENVVRYYTSWLEPTWTPGGGGAGAGPGVEDIESSEEEEASSDDYEHDEDAAVDPSHPLGRRDRQLLLGGPHHADESNWSFPSNRSNIDGGMGWDPLQSHPSDAFDSNDISTGGYGYGLSSVNTNDSEFSEWTVDQSHARGYTAGRMRDESSKPRASQRRRRSAKNQNLRSNNNHNTHKGGYKYQICLYIQMQLCRPSTLADWIRNRNSADQSLSTQHTRYLAAATIFKQISRGMAHVHSRKIVHRDMKPANIFHSADDDCFKIGDFGLSKVLRSANGGMPFGPDAEDEDEDEGTSSKGARPVDETMNKNKNNAEITHLVQWKDRNNMQDLLTAGIGTSSYAAPEQLASRTYGCEADIFSLGLILFELFSDFGSAHERAITFQNCRKGILPDWLTSSSPLSNVGELVLSCTKDDPKERPSAGDVLNCHLFDDTKVADMQAITIRKLELKLQHAEEENRRLREIIEKQSKQLSGEHDNNTKGGSKDCTFLSDDDDDDDEDY